MYRKIITLTSIAALAFTLSACGASPAPIETIPEVVATVEAPTPTVEETSDLTPVEASFVETFRISVPNDPATDKELVASAYAMVDELQSWLDGGGTSQQFLENLVARNTDMAVRNSALVAGAIALDPSLATHPNF